MAIDPAIQQSLRAALQKHQSGDLSEAEAMYRQVLERHPGHADALQLLGVLSYQINKLDNAADFISQAIAIAPQIADWHNNLGNVLKAQGKPNEAIESYTRSLQLKPNNAIAQLNLGNALAAVGRRDEALAAYRKAIEINPRFAEARLNLGTMLLERGQISEAIEHLETSVRLQPNSAEGHATLGRAYQQKHLFFKAAACYRAAIERRPDDIAARVNLALAVAPHDPDATVDELRRVLRDQPNLDTARSNLLVALHYRQHDPKEVFAEHLEWERQHAQLLRARIQPHANDRDPNRRLRIGYVSPDFCEHSTAYFSVSLLAGHDRSAFEVHVFDNTKEPDDFTTSLRPLVDRWHDIRALSHQQLADLVRKNQIDILIDLTGHFARNRLIAFALKPAPIQVTYLGYPDTTGLATMDYRFTDATADPPGLTEMYHSEQLVRLPETAWCYHPNPNAPPLAPLPMLTSGGPTFVSFNNFAKVSPETFDLWAAALRALPEARMLVKAAGLGEPAAQDRAHEQFEQRGISRQRVELMETLPDTADHLGAYARCDVALDTFPYHGTTTTCEALWMGVPVITLAGDRHVSRVGVSLLNSVGLGDLVSQNPDEFAAIAARLVSDPQKLAHLRATMRQRMAESPLTNFRRFAGHVEAAYRQMWKQWCAQPQADAATSPAASDHLSHGIDAYNAGKLDEAGKHFQAALASNPTDYEAANNLGTIYQLRGDIERAISFFRKSLELQPDSAASHSNLLLTLHYRAIDPQKLFDEHVEWARRHADHLSAKGAPHENSRDPDRRLRVGYVSADFHEHSVAYFSSSILRAHDHGRFEVVCFDNTEHTDGVTERLKQYANRWHRIAGMSDDVVAQLIRRERIDILVDLGGHTADNRLPVLARKPAPVQITYLGYPNTTGMRAMDYRITDAIADPPGLTERFHTEQLIRLSRGAWCYTPPSDAPPVAPLPMLSSGRPTFASFNNFAKVSPQTVTLWGSVLRAIPQSVMLIKAAGLSNAASREQLVRQFEAEGIAPDRLQLLGRDPSTAGHLALYCRCDVALDTYPYHGTTTTCEALWMGVPVITLMGNMHLSRVSGSLLHTVGLPELATNSQAEFVDRAKRLIDDPSRLAELRAGMRQRLCKSRLLAAESFVRDLETEYRRVWGIWCRDRKNSSGPNVRRAAHNQGNPDAAQAAYDHLWRGSAAFGGGRFDEAESHLQAAAQINPNSYEAANNLGTIYQLRGEIDRAISCYRKALEIRPDSASTHSNLLLTLHYRETDPQKIFDAHIDWARRHADPLSANIAPHTNSREPERRLRIGYVSADFKRHSVSFLFAPVLRGHNRERFEICCFDNAQVSDDVSKQIKHLADRWHRIAGLSDNDVAQLIRREEIDILVDLGGHTADNRLLVFARKPSPVQVTWLGYPNTTGMRTVDYRLTDAIADQPGITDRFHTEQLIRLSPTGWCYQPASESPPVAPLPMLNALAPVFASFNNFAKVSPQTMDHWAAVLKAIPESRMLIKAAGLITEVARQHARDCFTARGVDPARLELQPATAGHLPIYNRCDIALDTFPYSGTATTCEAMWMGVPVITLPGQTHVTRVSASLLTNVGLADLIANSVDGFVAIAKRLVATPKALANWRAGMRDRLATSPLFDGQAFARELEARYRDFWRTWCGKSDPTL